MFNFGLTPNFGSRLDKIRKTFTKAIAQSQKLDAQMEKAAKAKSDAAATLLSEAQAINELKVKNTTFMTNLTNLLG